MENPEILLLNLLRRGDESAYKYLYDNHYVPLCHVAYQYVNDIYLAETLVQDVIIHLWNHRESLEIKTSLRAYLIKATKNRCLDYFNMEHVRRETPFSQVMPEDRFIHTENYPLGHLLSCELEKEIKIAIKNLPSASRTVFYKSRFEGKSYEDIALELGISINTVKYHIKKSISLLRLSLIKYLMSLIILYDLF